MNGWVKLHRKMLDNPVIMKDAEHLAVWTYLLLNATHEDYPALFKGKKIVLEPGQLITGRKLIASALAVNESKVRRILDAFEIDQQIDRQRSNQNTLISLKNWEKYQIFDQQSDQLPTNDRPTTDQRPTTNKNIKNNKNVKNERNNKESALQLFNRLIADFTISVPLVEKMEEWIVYKSERKQTYKETGLKTLLKQVAEREQTYGSIAIMDLIDECMARNYSGIIWDRLKRTESKPDFVDMWRNV